MSKKDRKRAELVVAALEALAAGVVLRLKDWRGFSRKEKGAWIAALNLRARGAVPGQDVKPENLPASSAPAAEDLEEVDQVDPELLQVLEQGAERIELRRAEV